MGSRVENVVGVFPKNGLHLWADDHPFVWCVILRYFCVCIFIVRKFEHLYLIEVDSSFEYTIRKKQSTQLRYLFLFQ